MKQKNPLSLLIFLSTFLFFSTNSNAQFTIDVDATALSVETAFLSGPGSFSTLSVQSFSLNAGNYTIFYNTNTGTPTVAFSVLADGTVDYDTALDGVLDGRGTSALTVNGRTIQIDPTALAGESVTTILNVSLRLPTTGVATLTLLPGDHEVFYNTVVDLPETSFSVLNDGTVDFDTALDGVLAGRGTSTLTVNGRQIQLDATALTGASLTTTLTDSKRLDTDQVQALALLPGEHRLFYNTFVDFPLLTFTVLNDGTVDYDASLDGILSGRGTSTLAINGRTIQLDATALTSPTVTTTLNDSKVLDTDQVLALTLLPGEHRVFYNTFVDFPIFTFTVLNDGTIDYDVSLDGILSGRGTSTLKVNGRTIQLDATALTSSSLTTTLNVSEVLSTDQVQSLTLLPGEHRLFYNTFTGFPLVTFTVLSDGTIDYDTFLEGVFGGQGTSTLAVNGVSVYIDARGLTDPDFILYFNNVAHFFSSCTVQAVTLIPGGHQLYSDDINVIFTAELGNTIDYDASLDDDVSGRGTDTLLVAGTLNPFVVDAGTDASILPSGAATLGGSPTASGGLAPYVYSWTPTAGLDNATVANPTATPAGTTTYLVAVTDDRGCALTDDVTVTVGNASPVITSITGPLEPIAVDTEISMSATFEDVDGPENHTATWDWGDGTTSAGTVDQANDTVSGVHTYTEAGVYTVSLTVTDGEGASGDDVYQFIVVFDPDAGFVTGGGWIDSPAGAYVADPSLTGKANFGFVAKYKKGQSTPDGQTEFQFKVADLNFHSSSYDWLVVANHKATYKGEGTINQAGNYGFLITGIDEDLTPSTDTDLFRMKIWDKDNGDALVYDNQLVCSEGTDDDADPCTAIGGGNIKIHDNGNGNGNGNGNASNTGGEAGYIEIASEEVPVEYQLLQNYPNPFNPSTVLAFDLPESAQVRLVVYDMLGREVATLVQGVLDVGRHEVVFDAGSLPSGLYLYQLETAQHTFVQKMMLTK